MFLLWLIGSLINILTSNLNLFLGLHKLDHNGISLSEALEGKSSICDIGQWACFLVQYGKVLLV